MITRTRCFLLSTCILLGAFAFAQERTSRFFRNEIKVSGFAPGVHYEHFFKRRFSADVGISYSTFSLFPDLHYTPVSREVTKAALSTRWYFRDNGGTGFYWGAYFHYCYQWIHTPFQYDTLHPGTTYPLPFAENVNVHHTAMGVGLEMGYKLPVSARVIIETNVGINYNYYFNYRVSVFDTLDPYSYYNSPWRDVNWEFPLDYKMWISLNYLINRAE